MEGGGETERARNVGGGRGFRKRLVPQKEGTEQNSGVNRGAVDQLCRGTNSWTKRGAESSRIPNKIPQQGGQRLRHPTKPPTLSIQELLIRTQGPNKDPSFLQDKTLSTKNNKNNRKDTNYKNNDDNYSPGVCTLYKRKADKVKPVDSSQTDGTTPGGDPKWRDKMIATERYQPTKYHDYLLGKFSTVKTGSRLTKERFDEMESGTLTSKERDIFHTMLLNREAALAWDFSEIGCLKEEVAPSSEIRMVPHTPWQHPGFNIPRALRPKVTEMVDARLQQGLLEPCHGPYRNPWFLVKKKSTLR